MSNKYIKDFLICLLFALPAFDLFAQPVSVDYRGVTINQFFQSVVSDLLHKDYSVSPEVLADDRKITYVVTSKDSAKLMKDVTAILKDLGIKQTDINGTLYFSKEEPKPKEQGATSQPHQLDADGKPIEKDIIDHTKYEVQTYKPKYRSIDYLSKALIFARCKTLPNEGDLLIYTVQPEREEAVIKLLAELDTMPKSLVLKLALIEFSQSSDKARSFDFALTALSNKLNLVYQAGQSLANKLTFSGLTVQAALSAIEGDSRFNYLANPTLKILDNTTSKFIVGTEVPTRGQSSQTQNGIVIQSIDYKTSGIIITAKPQINGDSIILDLSQELSNFSQTTTSNIDSPSILKRSSNTVLDLRFGETTVIAGLDETRDNTTTSGFSFLPSFLKSNSSQKSKSQILLLVEVLNPA